MNRKLLTLLLSLALALAVWGGLPVHKAQAAITSVTLNYYPVNVPQDAPVGCATGTSFVVIATVNATDTGLDQYFTGHVTLGMPGSACTYNSTTGTWQAELTSTIDLKQFTIPASQTTYQVVFYVRSQVGFTSNSLRASVYSCDDGTFSYCPAGGRVSSSPAAVTPMDMTSSGGWLDESGGVDVAARAGRYIAVKNGSTLVGLYSAEDNLVPEGNSHAAGGFKVAAPSCTDCAYTIETWLPSAPGTAEGGINTMDANGCPSDIVAGAISSLDTCNSPTAILLESFAGTSQGGVTTLILVSLALAFVMGGLILVQRRRNNGPAL